MSKSATNQSRLRRVPVSLYKGNGSAADNRPSTAPTAIEEPSQPVEGTRLRHVPVSQYGAKGTSAAAASTSSAAIQGRPVGQKKSGTKTTSAQRQAQAGRQTAARRSQGPSRGILLGGILGILIAGAVLAFLAYNAARTNQNQSNNTTTQNPPPAGVSTQSGAVDTGAAGAVDTGNTDKGVGSDASSNTVKSTPDLNKPPVGLFDAAPTGVNRGELDLPRTIALDAAGNFYVSDTNNERIQVFDKSGKWLAMFGAKGSEDGQFNPMDDKAVGTGPGGIAVDKDGNIYVADTWNHRIQKFDKTGKFLAKWGTFASVADANSAADADINSKFWGPRGMAIGPEGNLYVTDTGNKRVLVFTPEGKFVRKIDSNLTQARIDAGDKFNKPGELNEPIGIAVDKDGNVFVADTHNNRIQKFDKDLKPVAQYPVPTTDWSPAPYLEPFLALDGAGNIYYTAPSSKAVVMLGPDGKEVGRKTSEGKTTLQRPTGLTVSEDGTAYVVDTEASHVVNMGKITPGAPEGSSGTNEGTTAPAGSPGGTITP